VRSAVEEKLRGGEPTADVYAGLPRRDPAELVELARQQGVKPLDFERLMQADFWPDEESADEFIATLRSWRREEAPPNAEDPKR
jgi:hypothetical protein